MRFMENFPSFKEKQDYGPLYTVAIYILNGICSSFLPWPLIKACVGLADVGDIQSRLLDHRPVINAEIRYFVKEFEVLLM